jgi:AFG3 family protein
MENQEDKKNKKPSSNGDGFKFSSYWVYGLIALVLIGINIYTIDTSSTPSLKWDKLERMLIQGDIKEIRYNDKIAEVYLKEDRIVKYPEAGKVSKLNQGRPQYTFEPGPLEAFNKRYSEIITRNGIVSAPQPDYTRDNPLIPFLIQALFWLVLFGLVWMFFLRRMGGGAGGPGSQIFNIGKSKATLFDNSNTKVNVTFADVAGLDEAKEEVMEVVDFLKNPKKYTTLGGKIPKGVLLVGPPGTGKTLLAKAVAGEAGVPFFSISGSDFVEMFVGVGASRVRDLFRQAREKAPCIVFIDEIDAIGRARGKGAMQGGNDERENTLNQLLVEMDGFSTDKGVILMAATNRADVLDSALMRPGRFDRQIGIDLPDLKGREQIFNVHLKSIKINGVISVANICNEAALIAARRNKSSIDMDDFNYALDKIIGGLEKKNKIISPEEKIIIAYHEAGHTICGWYLEHASPLVKVTIVPRGIGTLGYAQYQPKDEYIVRTEALQDRMCMTLGGRAAESIVFDKISTGAQSDLDYVTRMAYSMIAIYGMNDRIGNVSYYGMQQDQFNRPYSDVTASKMDEEVRLAIDVEYVRAKALLKEKRHELNTIAEHLLEKEVLLKSDVERLIGKRYWGNATVVAVEPVEPVKGEE